MHSIFPFMFVYVSSVEKFSGFLKHGNFLLFPFFIPIILYTHNIQVRETESVKERERKGKEGIEGEFKYEATEPSDIQTLIVCV